MAVENFHVDLTFPANADLSTHQYKWVKMATGGKVDICSAITDIPVGILQNKPTANQAASVRVLGVSKLKAGGTITVGSMLGTDAAALGKALVVGDTTQYVVGQSIAAAVVNDVVQVAVCALNPTRAN